MTPPIQPIALPVKSKGIASTIATLVAIAGAISLAYPNKLPFLAQFVKASPVIMTAVPLILTVGGSLYAAASSAVPWLRRVLPWKPARPATPASSPPPEEPTV
jgi:hypothetical protein